MDEDQAVRSRKSSCSIFLVKWCPAENCQATARPPNESSVIGLSTFSVE
jgi:hypothetical protein